MPKEGAKMKFKNYKNMLERPFILYADFECSLIPTDAVDKIARHEPNSAAAYFDCTFGNSRNKYYKFERKYCANNLILKFREISESRMLELKNKQDIIMSRKDRCDFKSATHFLFVKIILLQQTIK